MHTLVEVPVGTNGGTHVPAFLAKLWKIVDDPSTNDLIAWSDGGNSFVIKNQAKFARDLLPLYYKHNNMASFVRQLNMYGFHKVVSVEQGGLRVDKDEMEFAHPFFLKGQEASLELIKRKIPASKHEESRMRPDSFNKVLLDVRQMKGRQETMDTKLVTMKRENEALWRELASLRQKHAKQTQIVSKLLQFLVGMMSQQTPRLSFKRRMPLMLNDKDGLKQKLARAEAPDTGPVIHDVTELLESDDSCEDGDGDQESITVDPITIASITGKNPFAEVGTGRNSPDSPEMMFSVNPVTVNPTVATHNHNHVALQQQQHLHGQAHVDQNKQAKAKPKQGRKNSLGTNTLSSIKSEPTHVTFPAPAPPQQNITTAANTSIQQQQQLLQIPVMSTMAPQVQTNTTVPTTLYFSAPGMAEPVQVVLSVPDQNAATIPSSSGMTNVTTPIIVPSTTNSIPVSVSPSMNKATTMATHQQQQPQTMASIPQNKAAAPAQALNGMNGYDGIGRSQSINPKILMKANGSVQQDLDGHLDDMEAGLNNLRDLFKGNEQYHMDGDTLIGVSTTTTRPYFNLGAHDPEIYAQLFGGSAAAEAEMENAENQTNQNFPLNPQLGGDAGSQSHEVVTYNPSLFELAEEDSNFFDESSNLFLDDELESMLTTDRDALKRSEAQSQQRAPGHITFAGINLNHSLDSVLNTPLSEHVYSPGTSAASVSKKKRK